MKQERLFLISEKIHLGQKFDIEVGKLCGFFDISQNLGPDGGRADILDQSWVENLGRRIAHNLPINIVRQDLNIDRKLQNCFHKLRFKIFCFRPFLVIIRGTTQSPNSPGSLPRVLEIGFNRNSLC